MYKIIAFCLTLSLLFAFKSYSQDPPIAWGEIPMADLQMTSFPEDSNASAVILCDFGETKLSDEINLMYTRHLRVKILNQNGYDWGTHTIYLYHSEYGEIIDELKAITYSLDESGNIVETELDDNDIFEEEVTDTKTKYKFTMPALKPGSIIDIQYRIIAKSIWLIRDWTFQWNEPVLWSEYRIQYPKNISYAAVALGYEPWAISEYLETTQIFRGFAVSKFGDIAKCHQYRWAVKNAPALRDEPYITTIEDYANRVTIQLAGYAFIGTGVKKVLQNWTTLADELLDLESFGDKMDVTGNVEDLTSDITKGLASPEDKIKAIYNWITYSIVWTGEETIYADYDPDEVIEYKKGNSADITFLLLSMLKSAGINCDPVVLSTRSNGKIQELYPIVTQFDYVIAKVNLDPKSFFIDATDPFRTIDLLPEKVLNVKALVIKEDRPEWIFIGSDKNNLDKTIINVNLKEDGSLTANFEEQYGEYKSVSIRSDLIGKNETDIAKDLFGTESSGFILDSTKILEKDSVQLPFRIQAWVNSTNYSQVGGDFIYFNPVMIHRMTDNPFKAAARKFPIYYGFPSGQIIITNIIIPPDFEIKEKYENKTFTVEGVSYKRIVQVNDNHIQIMSKMDIKEVEIKPKYYSLLKNLYSQIIEAQSEMLVLGRKEDTINIEGSNEIKTEGSK